MATSLGDLAVLATSSYRRDAATNQVGLPPGFQELTNSSLLLAGRDLHDFFASAYFNTETGEFVIAIEGTNSSEDWTLANVPLAIGLRSKPFLLALEFFAGALKVASTHDTFQLDWNKVRFTGHSLGGGHASLLSIFFNRPAAVFATAPFGNSGAPQDIQAASTKRLVKEYFAHFANAAAALGGVPQQAVDEFRSYRDAALALQPLDNPIWRDVYDARVQRVEHHHIDGEILGRARSIYPTIESRSSPPPISLSGTLPLVDEFALHSMDLHAVLLRFGTFRERLIYPPF